MEEQSSQASYPIHQDPPPINENNINFWKYIGIGMSIVSFCIAIGAVGYIYSVNKNVAPAQIACTMEAKLCPDGLNYVGRTGPKCEFSKCPEQTTKWLTYIDPTNHYSIDYPSYLTPTRKATDPEGFISFERVNKPTHFIIVDIANPNDSLNSKLLNMIPGQKSDILSVGLWYERNEDLNLPSGTGLFYDFEEVVPDFLIKQSPPSAKYLDSKFVPGQKASLRGKNIFIEKNGLLYGITIDLNPEGDDQMEMDFNTMFVTFKFTTCTPRPMCLDATPRCMIPETADMCPKSQ